MYKLLTGRVPFEGESPMDKLMARHTCPAPRVRTYRPEIPEEIDAVIAKAIAADPEDRYQTPGELAEAIAPYADPDLPLTALESPSQLMWQLENEDPPTDAGSRTVEDKSVERSAPSKAPVALSTYAAPKVKQRQRPTRQMPVREVLMVLGVVLLSAATVWWWSQPTRLILHWSVSQRDGGGLMIDGVVYPLREFKGQDPITIDIAPGAHEVIVHREHFPPIVWNISASRGDDLVRHATWRRPRR